ncbi:MAG: phenylacetate-coenzyme ligase [Myxococcaceae bacterium]|nr:phenylacetate-coenzyme ligase [Myxococcaceae bacterium]
MKLRAEVEIHLGADPSSACVTDLTTGLNLVVSRDIASFLTRLRDEAWASSSAASEESLLAFFRQLGLMTDATPEQARLQQALYILTDAEFAELPRVRQTVQRAYAHTALHREQLGQALAKGEWDLEDLPLLHKSQLRRHFPRGLTVDTIDLRTALRRGDLVVASTSGTTGERLQVYSDTRVERLPHDFASLWGLTSLPSGRPLRTAVLTSPSCTGGICTRRNTTMQERISFEHTLFLETTRDPFELTHAQISAIARELEQFTPDLWIVNPVYLLLLTELAEGFGIRLPRPHAIVTTYQYSSPAQHERLSRAHGAPVFQMYSATELGSSQIGISCRHGALHVRLDHAFVEIVKDGVRVEPGRLGNPVVTTHHPSMPLVRYQLTDLARFALAPCACEVGSAWPTLLVEGRERDAFSCRGQLVTTAMVDAALAGLPVLLYQLHERRPGAFSIAIIAERDSALSLEDVRARLSTLLHPESLELTTAARLSFEESGKFRYTHPYTEPAHG